MYLKLLRRLRLHKLFTQLLKRRRVKQSLMSRLNRLRKNALSWFENLESRFTTRFQRAFQRPTKRPVLLGMESLEGRQLLTSTITQVSVSAPYASYSSAETFTATVKDSSTGTAASGGTVQFQVDGANFGSAVSLTSGTATLTTSTLAMGNHYISASYSGSGNYSGSSSGTGQSSIFDGSSTSYVQLDPINAGELSNGFSIGFWAYPTTKQTYARYFDFTNYDSGTGNPKNELTMWRGPNVNNTGNVRLENNTPDNNFYPGANWNNSIILDTWQYFVLSVNSSGQATWFQNGTNQGTNGFGSQLELGVGRAITYIGKSAWNGDPFFQGQMHDFTVWNYPLTQTQVASAATTSYPNKGNGVLLTALSNQATAVVIGQEQTYTSVSASSSSLTPGQSVTLTATVGPMYGCTVTPTGGTVQFQVDGSNLGSVVNLSSNGTATLTTSALTTGSHKITAYYSGNGNFRSANSYYYPINDSFEAPNLGYGVASYNPTNSVWSFTGTSGIAPRGAFNLLSVNYDGNYDGGISDLGQAAFFQGSGAISTTFNLPAAATPIVKFQIENSANNNPNNATVYYNATIDTTNLGTTTGSDWRLTRNRTDVTTARTTLAAGSHTLTFTGSAPDGVSVGFFDSVYFDMSAPVAVVNPSTTTLTSSSSSSKVYGSSITYTASVSPTATTGTVTFKDGSTVLGTATLSGGTASLSTTAVAVGTRTITAVYGGDSSYSSSTSNSLSQVMTAAPLTVTANSLSRVYGATDPTLGVTYSGFVNNDTSSVLGGTLSIVNSRSVTTTVVGTYAGAITASGLTSSNYNITYVAGNLTVTAAPLTVTANSVSRVYGSADPALGVTYTGLVNGETASALAGTLVVTDSRSATTTAVGTYAGVITASGLTSSNYAISFVAGSLTVTAAPLTITANTVSRVYGSADPALGVTYTGLVNGETASALAGTLVVTDSRSATTTAVGTYAGVITASGLTSSNYSINYVASGLTVTRAPLTVTANNVTRVYGAADPTLGVTYSGFVNNETTTVLGGTLTLANSKSALTTGAGTYSGVISGSGLTSSNYAITFVAGTLTVTPAVLTVTAKTANRVYGGSDQTQGVTYSGFVNNETTSVLGGTLAITDSQSINAGVGTYSGVILPSGLTNANYTFNYVAGPLTITAAPLTITANSVSRAYGASDPTLGVTYSGLVNNETATALGGTLSVVNARSATTTNVGTYAGVITASGLTSSNYTISYVSGSLAVTAAPLTVTAGDQSHTYGTSLALGFSAFTTVGLKNGETVSSVTLSSTGGLTTTAGAGTYTITPNALTGGTFNSSNYSVTYVTGTLTVNKAVLTVTTKNATRVYGGTDPALGVNYSGFVNNESTTVLGGTLSLADSLSAPTTGAGTYAGAITASGLTAANYSFNYVAGTLTVTQAPLTVTAKAATRVYGGPDQTQGVTYAGFVNSESSSVLGGLLTLTNSRSDTSTSVGTYAGAITASGLASPNYAISYLAGPLTVTPAHLTVTANNVTRIYNHADPVLGVTYSGFANGESSIDLDGSLTVTDSRSDINTPAGTYAGTITASGLTSSNYTITYTTGSLTVLNAPLTVTVNPVSRVYGAADATLSVFYTGFLNNDNESVLGGTLVLANANSDPKTPAGTYPGVISASGLTSTNYTITYELGDLTVIPAALAVTANDITRVYGASDLTTAVTYTGFVNGDTSSNLNGILSVTDSNADPTTPVGNYTDSIIPSGLSSSNYNITFVSGGLTVSPAPLTISANSVTRIYGAADPTLDVTYSGFVNGETSSNLDGTLSVSNLISDPTSLAGVYPDAITATGLSSSNYTIIYLAAPLTITPAPLTVSVNNVSRVYGQADPTFGVTYSGFVNGESSNDLGGSLSLSNLYSATTTATGNYSGAITASGLSSTNYTISYVPGSLTVSAAPLTVTVSSVTRVYGVSDPALNVTYSGFINGESASILDGTLTITDAKAASNTRAGTYPGAITANGLTGSNYAITYVPGSLTVTTAPLTVTPGSITRPYGSSDPIPSLTYSGFVNDESASALGGNLKVSDTKPATTGVGAYTDVVTISGLTSANYTITYRPGSLTITPAPLTVTAVSKSMLYNGQTFKDFTVSFKGLANHETLATSGITGAPGFTGDALTAQTPGNYDIIPDLGTLQATNYTFTTFTNGVLAITNQSGTTTPNEVIAGGLEFITSSQFATSGGIQVSTGTVQVGYAPIGGSAFIPILELDGTVTIDTGALSLAATGTVSAVIGDVSIPLITGGLETSSITELIDTGLTGLAGANVTVAGTTFTLTSLVLDHSGSDPQILLQGTINLDGVTIAVTGSNYVVIGSAGASLTGVSATLAGGMLDLGALTFSTSDLMVSYTTATDRFVFTGSSTVEVAGLGSATLVLGGGSTQGLIVTNGLVTSFDATLSLNATLAGGILSATDDLLTYLPGTTGSSPDTFMISGPGCRHTNVFVQLCSLA